VLSEVGIDSGLKLSHRGKASTANGLGGDTCDHVEPRTAGRSEVKVEAWVAQQPAMDFRGFMGGVVVNYEMKLTVSVIAEFGVYERGNLGFFAYPRRKVQFRISSRLENDPQPSSECSYRQHACR
jgi:hypothetical protein